jgi:hypothetical protein
MALSPHCLLLLLQELSEYLDLVGSKLPLPCPSFCTNTVQHN